MRSTPYLIAALLAVAGAPALAQNYDGGNDTTVITTWNTMTQAQRDAFIHDHHVDWGNMTPQARQQFLVGNRMALEHDSQSWSHMSDLEKRQYLLHNGVSPYATNRNAAISGSGGSVSTFNTPALSEQDRASQQARFQAAWQNMSPSEREQARQRWEAAQQRRGIGSDYSPNQQYGGGPNGNPNNNPYPNPSYNNGQYNNDYNNGSYNNNAYNNGTGTGPNGMSPMVNGGFAPPQPQPPQVPQQNPNPAYPYGYNR